MSNTYTKLSYHIIFSTKDRLPLIKSDIQKSLYRYIGGIIRTEKGTLLQAGGMPDHIHLAAQFRADVSVSEMLRRIKGASSKWINEQASQTVQFRWQRGYGAFAVSQSQLDPLISYIQNQQTHHRHRSFQKEFLDFLKNHHIEYEEKYLWN